MELIKTAALINKEITSIKAAGKKLDDRIQLAGLSVLNHVEEHGDVTVVNALFLALPQGARAKALAEWLLAFGKLAKNGDKKAAKAAPFVYDKGRSTDLTGAVEQPWFKFAKKDDTVESAFDFQASLKALLDRAAKAEKEGKSIAGADQLAKIRAMVAV